MALDVHHDRLGHAIEAVSARLLSEMGPDGWWVGRLSSSALSTATCVSALTIAGDPADRALIDSGCLWLIEHQNADGGFGDTPDSPSNLQTTLLVISALKLAQRDAAALLHRASAYVARWCEPSPPSSSPSPCTSPSPFSPTSSSPSPCTQGEGRGEGPADLQTLDLAGAVTALYGADRTFAVPILMNCALAGLVPWNRIPRLPFELAVFPRSWYKALRLHVVSYALPALIGIGLVLHHYHPTRNPLLRGIRRLVRGRVLRKLLQIQPDSGGFLEATPLTCFVTMGLVRAVGADHPVVLRALGFLRGLHRPDGSWPIDTNLSVWVTTAAFIGLSQARQLHRIDAARTLGWIVDRQERAVHPFTGAAPGAWGWTHYSGGVPDADDTSAALIALTADSSAPPGAGDSIPAGLRWLLDLQNTDGGWPTFCRGWGRLPFDRSAPELTGHVLRALQGVDPQRRDAGVRRAISTALGYLGNHQRADGSWTALWFGNQYRADRANPVFGTSRVLRAYEELGLATHTPLRGVAYLLAVQNADGGWGAGESTPSTTEETSLAVGALVGWRHVSGVGPAVERGADWLLGRIDRGGWDKPSPIGLYFANLWYSERLYPVVWALDALGRLKEASDNRQAQALFNSGGT
jgi:squalene-hopene/tetraprenyl-beta-curcumene cyclase